MTNPISFWSLSLTDSQQHLSIYERQISSDIKSNTTNFQVNFFAITSFREDLPMSCLRFEDFIL